MDYFINLDATGNLSINPWRRPDALVGDIGDVAEALLDVPGWAVCCGLEGAKDALLDVPGWAVCCGLEGAKDALEDGEYLAHFSTSTEAVETLHALICGFEDRG
jgi:hypothetical protein